MEESAITAEHLFFSDGSSLGNPGPGGWGAVVVINGAYASELGGRAERTTNNKMELTGAIEALKRLRDEEGRVVGYLDSQYVIKGVTEWRGGWERRGWVTMTKTPVENRGLWEELFKLVDERTKRGGIVWRHIPGHIGIAGNERVDEIATGYARDDHPGLFEGAIGDYAIDILHIGVTGAALEARLASRSRSRAKAYCYVSNVGGKIVRHTTWEDCEKRVRGKKGALYKKALTPEDERMIRRSWGERQ